ncbi:MAG: hypothetical protein P8Z42_03030, partial [Anaerolineales bacterium]
DEYPHTPKYEEMLPTHGRHALFSGQLLNRSATDFQIPAHGGSCQRAHQRHGALERAHPPAQPHHPGA